MSRLRLSKLNKPIWIIQLIIMDVTVYPWQHIKYYPSSRIWECGGERFGSRFQKYTDITGSKKKERKKEQYLLTGLPQAGLVSRHRRFHVSSVKTVQYNSKHIITSYVSAHSSVSSTFKRETVYFARFWGCNLECQDFWQTKLSLLFWNDG